MPDSYVESPTPEKLHLPSEFGFDPVKFPEFRPGQYEAAEKVADSEKPLFLVEAPTGSGKSLLAMTAFQMMRSRNLSTGSSRGVYLVSTKQLQDQIQEDFDVPVLKGRSNYPCLKFPDLYPEVTSEICREYLGDRTCEFEHDCPYLIQKRKALKAPICVLNYPLFLTEANFVGAFSGLDLIIADECDTIEEHLMSFVEVPITRRLLARLTTQG